MPPSFDYAGYLAAKKVVDDRSLNREVWSAMTFWVEKYQARAKPIQILETGAGIGTMIDRILDEKAFDHCLYTVVERESGFRDVAMKRLEAMCSMHQLRFTRKSDNAWSIRGPLKDIGINWITADLMNIKDQFAGETFDLIIGHAIIDLVPVPVWLPELLGCLKKDGAFYFSLNYAGLTRFQPAHPLDQAILQAYHRHMDKRFPGLNWRASQTGRVLGDWLDKHHCQVIAEGSSDWDLSSGLHQAEDIPLFMANILDTIADALAGLPELPEWVSLRRRQLEAGELRLYAANRDYFGRTGNPYIGTRS